MPETKKQGSPGRSICPASPAKGTSIGKSSEKQSVMTVMPDNRAWRDLSLPWRSLMPDGRGSRDELPSPSKKASSSSSASPTNSTNRTPQKKVVALSSHSVHFSLPRSMSPTYSSATPRKSLLHPSRSPTSGDGKLVPTKTVSVDSANMSSLRKQGSEISHGEGHAAEHGSVAPDNDEWGDISDLELLSSTQVAEDAAQVSERSSTLVTLSKEQVSSPVTKAKAEADRLWHDSTVSNEEYHLLLLNAVPESNWEYNSSEVVSAASTNENPSQEKSAESQEKIAEVSQTIMELDASHVLEDNVPLLHLKPVLHPVSELEEGDHILVKPSESTGHTFCT